MEAERVIDDGEMEVERWRRNND
ncbi:hypothetical protein A2U01_0070383, partial [Trifolium medium]|nr:hypothetical protein [Trifolium medium]